MKIAIALLNDDNTTVKSVVRPLPVDAMPRIVSHWKEALALADNITDVDAFEQWALSEFKALRSLVRRHEMNKEAAKVQPLF